MKKHVLSWLLIASSFSLFAQESVGTVVDSTVYQEFEVAAVFPGCEQLERSTYERLVCASELLHNFIYDNLKYPEEAKQHKLQGIVVVSFVVDPDGSTSNHNAVNFLNTPCNQEALRIAQSMPTWLPAEKNGVKIRSEASIAVRFKLLQDGVAYRPPFTAPKPTAPTALIVDKPKTQTQPVETKAMEQPLAPFTLYTEKQERPILSEPDYENEVFKVVEVKPCFPGCEGIDDQVEKRKCAETQMLGFIYGNVKYPPQARAAKIEGTVYIRFIVDKDGTILSPELVRSIGGGCDEEALRVVSMMPKWEPGKQKGHPVKVQYNLPVKFKLK